MGQTPEQRAKENGDKPATGIPIHPDHGFGAENATYPGLTKREQFAMAAMQGLVVDNENSGSPRLIDLLSVRAVQIADALLLELEKTKP
jgi:hypothetical protein